MWDFKTKGVVDTMDDVPEKYRGLYVKADSGDHAGKFVIAESAKGIVEDYVGTAESYNRARADKKTASDESAARRHKLKAFEDTLRDLGIDVPDDGDVATPLKTKFEEMLAASKSGQNVKVDMEKIKKDFEVRMGEAIGTKNQELEKMSKSLQRYLVDENVTRAISEAKGSVPLLSEVIAKQCRVVADGDNYAVRVVDPQGDHRSDGKGGWLTVADLIGEIKKQEAYAPAFKSETAAGIGTQTGRTTAVVKTNGEVPKTPVNLIEAGLNERMSGRS